MQFKFNLILAKSQNNGIGFKNRIPWKLDKELNYFNRMTTTVQDPEKTNAVIMGRLTWESIPPKYRPLSKRMNIVLSSQEMDLPNATHFKTLQAALDFLKKCDSKIETTWIIGGTKVYEAAVREKECHRIYMTHILRDFECDTFVNIDVSNGFKEVSDPNVPEDIQEENGIKYIFKVYEKI